MKPHSSFLSSGGCMSNPNDPFQYPQNPNNPSGKPPQSPPQQPYGQPPFGQQASYGQQPGPQYPPSGQAPYGQQPQGYSQPYQAPGNFPTGQPYYGNQTGDATGGLIPYKNPKALIAYYCAIGGIVPALGLPFAIAAIVLGFLGLSARKKDPIIKGSVHAWIGVIGGFIGLMLNSCIVFAIVAALMGSTAENNRGKFTLPPTRTSMSTINRSTLEV